MIQQVEVSLGHRSYAIRIGSGLIERVGEEIQPFLSRPRVAIIMDDNAARFHSHRLQHGLNSQRISFSSMIVPSGESSKSWESLQSTVEWLIEQRIERKDTILAFGGGVVGDLAGFAAAILRRGVDCIQLPSTLLAQVDSSVGGKTGINSTAGKNLVGAFHQPRAVICDVELLQSLPRREFLAGCGEVVKYGLIKDSDFFTWLEDNVACLDSSHAELVAHAVSISCSIKAALVVADEREQGERALLNLGHTFGHALEAATGFSKRLLHGEGVAIGCCLALELSRRLGHCNKSDASRAVELFRSLGMKTAIHEIEGAVPTVNELVYHMRQDKKIEGDRMKFVLCKAIGDAFVTDQVAMKDVRNVLLDSLQPQRTNRAISSLESKS